MFDTLAKALPTRWVKIFLIMVLLMSVLAASYLAVGVRYPAEKESRRVEFALYYDELKSLAGLSGKNMSEALGQLKLHGVSAVVLREPMLDELFTAGDIDVYRGGQLTGPQAQARSLPWLSELLARTPVEKDHTYLVINDSAISQQLFQQLENKLENVTSYRLPGGTTVIETVAGYETIKGLGVGFTQAALEDIRQADLRLIIQVRTWPGITQEEMEKTFSTYQGLPNLSAILFNDSTVPGYPGLLPGLAEQVRGLGIPVGEVEFFPQEGLNKLGLLLNKQVVRVHTIPQNELKQLSPDQALDRYTLAAVERNHRVLMIRPNLTNGNPLQDNLGFIDRLRGSLEQAGLQVGPASLLPPVQVSRLWIFLAGLGVISGGLLLLEKRLNIALILWVGFLASLIWATMLLLNEDVARKGMALVAAILFPILSMTTFIKRNEKGVANAVVSLLGLSLVSLLGSVFMVGLLTDAGYMLKLNQYAGVKLTYLVPPVVVTLYFLSSFDKGSGVCQRLKGFLQQPVSTGLLLGIGVLVAAGAIYLLRTGNEGIVVSDTEIQFRTALAHFLGVRPRTKEFLLGNPALLLLLRYGYRDHRYLPLLLLAAIGQTSMVATFAHTFTPLLISLERATVGILLGVILGLVFMVVWKLFYVCFRKPSSVPE